MKITAIILSVLFVLCASMALAENGNETLNGTPPGNVTVSDNVTDNATVSGNETINGAGNETGNITAEDVGGGAPATISDFSSIIGVILIMFALGFILWRVQKKAVTVQTPRPPTQLDVRIKSEDTEE